MSSAFCQAKQQNGGFPASAYPIAHTKTLLLERIPSAHHIKQTLSILLLHTGQIPGSFRASSILKLPLRGLGD